MNKRERKIISGTALSLRTQVYLGIFMFITIFFGAQLTAVARKKSNNTPVPEPAPRHGRWKAHIMRGVFSDYYLLDAALSQIPGIKVDSSSLSYSGRCRGFGGGTAAIYRNDLLIMAGTGLWPLNKRQLTALKKWLNAGGSLLIIGGPRSFVPTGAGYKTLKELLPVKIPGPFNLTREKVIFKPNSNPVAKQIMKGIDLNKPMVAMFRHQLTAKPGATVIIGTTAKPVLAISSVGKGKIACLTTPAMGAKKDCKPGETPFWNDARFPLIIKNLAQYLITRKKPAKMAHLPKKTVTSQRARKIIARLAESEMDIDLDSDDDDSSDIDIGGDKKTNLKISPAELKILCREGGAAAVKPLLDAMPGLIKEKDIRAVEWAVRPYVTQKEFKQLMQISKAVVPIKQIRISTLSLLGKSDPGKAAAKIKKYLSMRNQQILRAALRSVGEGNLKQFLPKLRQLHKTLKKEVEKRRLSQYNCYWFDGVPPNDPLLAYTECTMAMLKMGEKDILNDAFNLLFLLHLQNMKIRSFIFSYNLKVPREAENAKLHHLRDAFVGPDLKQLTFRLQQSLAETPAPLQAEYRKNIIEIDDYEKMRPLLYPTWILIHDNTDGNWQGFAKKFTEKVMETAIKSERF